MNRQRWSVLGDAWRTQLWPVPSLAVMVAVVLGVVLPHVDGHIDEDLPTSATAYLFSGGPEAGPQCAFCGSGFADHGDVADVLADGGDFAIGQQPVLAAAAPADTEATMKRVLGDEAATGTVPTAPEHAVLLSAGDSGFLTSVDEQALLAAAVGQQRRGGGGPAAW